MEIRWKNKVAKDIGLAYSKERRKNGSNTCCHRRN